MCVRARKREDLKNLLDFHYGKDGVHPGIISGGEDYAYRIFMDRSDFADMMKDLAWNVDYPNFKSAVGKIDQERANIYANVWATMYFELNEEPPVPLEAEDELESFI